MPLRRRRTIVDMTYWLFILIFLTAPLALANLDQFNQTHPLSIDENSERFKSLPDSAKIQLLMQQCWALRTFDRGRAYDFGLHALQLANHQKRFVQMATLHNYLGVVQRNANNYTPALHHFYEALQIAETHSVRNQKAYAYNNIGNILNLQKHYQEAVAHSAHALRIMTQEEDTVGMAYCHFHMGRTMEGLNQLDSALTCQFNALRLRKSIASSHIPVSLIEIARLYQEKGNWPMTRQYLNESRAYLEKVPDEFGLSLTILRLGQYYLNVDSLAQAALALESTLKMGTGSQYWNRKRIAAGALADIYASQKAYKKALAFQKIMTAYGDSLGHESSLMQINDLSLEYRYNQEKEKLEALRLQGIRRSRRTQHILLMGLLLISLLAFIYYQQYRIKKKAHTELEERNALIVSQKEDLERYSHELSESNKTKDKFFSIIAHDLRSPFTTILHFAKSLKEQIHAGDPMEMAECANAIESAAKQSHNLLNNLLEWSRTQTGRLKYEPETFAINGLIEEAGSLLAPAFAEKHLTLHTELQPGLEIFADYNMLLAVLRNLLSNAHKFSKQGGNVTVKAYADHDSTAVIVQDTGVGIQEEHLNKLFDIGEDFSTLGTAQEEGTGLGLILCKEFIDRHCGRISVTSEYGQGTAIAFEIPYTAHA